MKVLFLSDAGSIHTVKWVNSLVSRGHEVHLIFRFNDEPKENEICGDVILHRLKYSGNKGYILNVRQLRKIYNSIKPDVVNAHYASGYGTLARLARIRPLILSVWGSDVFVFPYQNRFKKKIIVDNLRYANEIASTSLIMADKVRELLNEEYKKITITPFGVDLSLFQYRGSKSNEEVVIGNIKSLKKIYGLEYLINAISILKKQLEKDNMSELRNKVKVYIYGDGPERDNLLVLIKELNLVDTVYLKGKIPNSKVPEALASFDIFCATSIQESFGVSLIEAMAMELPIVATPVPGFIEIVDDNRTGLIADSMDPYQIAKALQILISKKELRERMGKHGREKAEEKFDWDKNVDIMISLYNSVVGRK